MICSDCNEEKPDTAFRPGIDATVCFGCRVGSAQFLSMAPQAAEARSRERQFSKDSAAYRRLRAQGIQPNHVDGSAMAEKMATHPIEIEIGRDLHPTERKALVRTNGTI